MPLYKKGTYETALALLQESNAKYKEQHPSVLYHLALAYNKTGDKKAAREALHKALALGKEFPEVDEAKKLVQATK